MSREALGDAPPDALADAGARSGDAPAATAVLGTVTIAPRDDDADRPDDPPTRGLALRPPAPAAPSAAPAVQDDRVRHDGDLDLDLGDDDAPPDAPAVTTTAPRPRRPRLVTAAAVVALLVVGALAGATSARQSGQARLDAAARIVVAVHVDQNGFFGGGIGLENGDALQFVEISMIGALGEAENVKVERLDTPVGSFEVYAPVTTADGQGAQRTLLKGTVDCDRANALKDSDTLTGRVLQGSTAVVRPAGSSLDVEVPVVVPNPDATLFTFDQRCNPQNYGSADAPAYSVGALVAHADGSLDFVASPGTAVPLRSTPARLAVVSYAGADGTNPFVELEPTQESTDSATYAIPNTRWSMTVSPALPRVIEKPTLVQVRFGYFCRRARLTDPPALPQLPPVSLGTISSVGGVNPYLEGWDESVMQSAMTAAAVIGCARPTTGAPPPVAATPAPTATAQP